MSARGSIRACGSPAVLRRWPCCSRGSHTAPWISGDCIRKPGFSSGPYLRVITFSALPLLLYADVSAVSAGHAPRAADHDRPRDGQCDQRRCQLGADLRQPRACPHSASKDPRGRRTAARVYMAAFLYVAIRLEHRRRGDRHPKVDLAFDLARIRRLIALGFPAASQVALEVGVFAARHGARGTARSGFVRRASDRAQHRVARVHGAARPGLVGGRAGRLCLWRWRSAPGRRRRGGRRWRRRRNHDRARTRVLSVAGGSPARVHAPIRASSRSASACWLLPQRFSCSMERRRWQPVRFAASRRRACR